MQIYNWIKTGEIEGYDVVLLKYVAVEMVKSTDDYYIIRILGGTEDGT